MSVARAPHSTSKEVGEPPHFPRRASAFGAQSTRAGLTSTREANIFERDVEPHTQRLRYMRLMDGRVGAKRPRIAPPRPYKPF